MTELITLAQAQAWTDSEKLTVAALDDALLTQVQDQVLALLANSQYDTSTWSSTGTTPSLVQDVIAMLYVAWLYDRTYSEDIDDGNAWSKLLRQTAAANIAGILDGTFILIGVTVANPNQDTATFYPNDDSSAMEPTMDDSSLGDAKFSMGMRF